jgi:hypothetical protein
MPVVLRKFYYDKLVGTKKKEKEEIDKSNKKSSVSNSPMSRFKR